MDIALIVYHFAFKLLGLFLFVVEIVWFIVLPIFKEVAVWWKMRNQIRLNKGSAINLLWAAGFVLLFIAPLDRNVELGAVRHSAQTAQIFATEAGVLNSSLPLGGASVEQNQLLAEIVSPKLDNEILISKQQVEILQNRLARIHADEEDRALLPVLKSELAAANQRNLGLLENQHALNLVAPIDGMIVDLDEDLQIGQWVGEGQPLAKIIDPHGVRVSAIADEAAILRIVEGANGHFIPDDPSLPAHKVRVSKISRVASTGKLLRYLQDRAGGNVPVKESEEGDLEAIGAWYPLTLEATEETAHIFTADSIIRGKVVLDADPTSLTNRIIKQVAAVLVRESGF